QNFHGHIAIEDGVASEVDIAHATGAQNGQNLVGAESERQRKSRRRCESLHEPISGRLERQETFHLTTYRFITAALAEQQRRARLGRAVQSRLTDPLDLGFSIRHRSFLRPPDPATATIW